MAEASAPLAGRTVVFAGRLLAVTRRQAERAVAAQGGQVQRGLTRRSDLLVVGRALGEGAALERLEDKLARADRLCVRCIGEARFLAAAGLAPPRPAEPRPLALA
ncbi:MAG: hypothetical protein IRY94_18200, partial [Rhodospirillaceae bacterium]|nr:hypothetical protein [Rhodospirillaceae bacterium]